MRAKQRGFTLVEILVVVGIVAVLMAILLPSLRRARQSAQQVACASNLRQWGLMLQQYEIEYKGRIPETVANFGGIYPILTWVDHSDTGQFSATILAKYMPTIDFVHHTIGKLWFCPANESSDPGALATATWPNGYFSPHYAYFAHVERWSSFASRPQDLVEQRTRADRLWMSDVIWRWSFDPFPWRYNHGRNGSSNTDTSTGNIVDLGPPNLSGANQLFGDGHVTWKPRASFDINRMQNMNAADDLSIGWVKGGNWDRTFY